MKNCVNIIQFVLLVILCVASFGSVAEQRSKFVASDVCASCHQEQFDAWSKSHHAWAWREPVADNVLADFDDTRFGHRGFSYRFSKHDGGYVVTADGPDGKSATYPVRYVVGVTPLQQYLVETERGRLQALDVAWDTKRKRWYHLYPDQDTSAGNGMHWSGPYKNWNARCAECHATDFKKNYEPLKDRYQSTQAEIGVGCEACHGPGEAHVAWAADPARFDQAHWQGVGAAGLSSVYRKDDPASQINLCAPCHSRREPLGAESPAPGALFDDHYRLSLLRDGLYFPDGQIRDEVYVYGSFLQSKMYAAGVKCTNCHDAHSYELKLQGNAVCTQCHNARGNPAFPSLKQTDYDTPAHHFHEPGTEAAACKSCHMPERNYMVVDGRRDHSFRIPRPALSAELGSPDVCIDCHKDKNHQWAAKEITTRSPGRQNSPSHFGAVFAVASGVSDPAARRQLTKIATDESLPAIVRASALARLSTSTDGRNLDQLTALLDDESSLVRIAAIGRQRSAPHRERIEALVPLLADPVQSVRLEAAKAMLSVPEDQMPANALPALKAAMSELKRSLYAKADFPEIQLVIGGVALTLRNIPAATSAFRRAVDMDPQLTQAWMMLARIRAAVGDQAGVRQTLEEAIGKNPNDAALRSALAALGESGSAR